MSQEPELLCPVVIPEDPMTWPRYHIKRENFVPKTHKIIPAYLVLLTVPKATILNQDIAQMVEEALVICEKAGRTNIRRDAAKVWAWNFREVGEDGRIVLKEKPEFTPEDRRMFDVTTQLIGARYLMTISNSIIESGPPPLMKRKHDNESATEQPTSPVSKKGRATPAPDTTTRPLSPEDQDDRSDDARAATNKDPPITAAKSTSGPSIRNMHINKMLQTLKPHANAIRNKRESLESDLLAAKNEITLCNKRSEEQDTRIKELETQLNTRTKELETQLNTHQTISNHNAEVIKEHQVANEQEKAKSANLFNVLVSLKNFMDDAIDEQDMAPIVAYVKDEYGVDLEWESSDKE